MATWQLTNKGFSLDLVHNIDYWQFNTEFVDGSVEGRLQWNSEDGTLEYGLPGGNVTLQIGQEQLVKCVNNTGSTIEDGDVVYVSGAAGSRPEISLASSATGTGNVPIGMATEDIEHQAQGYVNIGGLVRGIDTSAIASGSVGFLSDTVPGALRATPPDAPNYTTVVGYCLFSDADVGIFLVRVLSAPRLVSLSDTLAAAPNNGELYRWVAGNSRFELGDHGDIPGLTDDDHTGYILVDGTRAFTGDVTIGPKDIARLWLKDDAPLNCLIAATATGLYIEADVNNAVADTTIDFNIDGTSRMVLSATGALQIDAALTIGSQELTEVNLTDLLDGGATTLHSHAGGGSGDLLADGSVPMTADWPFGNYGLYIGDTVNTNMTIGLTINQGANDDSIISLKSSDVAHGEHGGIEADTFADFKKQTDVEGGLSITAFKDSNASLRGGLTLTAKIDGDIDTVLDHNARDGIEFWCLKTDGAAAVVNQTEDGNLFGVGTYYEDAWLTVFHITAPGEGWFRRGIFINESANTKMTIGLTINQHENDDEILAFKSQNDVSHGMTDVAETNTYGSFNKVGATDGGLMVRGLTEATRSLFLVGYATSDNTDKTATAEGIVTVYALKKSGAGAAEPGTNANCFVVNAGQYACFIVDREGDTFQLGVAKMTGLMLGSKPLSESDLGELTEAGETALHSHAGGGGGGDLLADGSVPMTADWPFGAYALYINDTVNANMTFGITIQQGILHDEILTLKNEDVTHGYTNLTETDTFAFFKTASDTGGGLMITGMRDSSDTPHDAIRIVGYLAENATTVKSSSSRGIISLFASQSSGNGAQNIVADGNIFSVSCLRGGGETTVFILDEDGDLWLGGVIVALGTNIRVENEANPYLEARDTTDTDNRTMLRAEGAEGWVGTYSNNVFHIRSNYLVDMTFDPAAGISVARDIVGQLDETIPEVIQQDAEPGTTYPGLIWVDTDADPAGTNTTSLIQDNDQDTKVQCEESADEDKVRIDTEGDEVAVFESLGNVQPLQPAFQIMLTDHQWITTLDEDRDIFFNEEVYDVGDNFNTDTYTFTAPVTGKYDLSLVIRFGDMDTGAQYISWKIITSNRSYTGLIDPNYTADLTLYPVCLNVLADMDTSDTAYCVVRQNLGANTLLMQREALTVFSGHLAC
jgi:hypothetical protein